MSEHSPKVSFEEFKLYFETTERVTDRRLETNRWNYSVCLAMFVGIAIASRWAIVSSVTFVPGIVAVTLLSAMAIVFCRHWLAQIADFKSLNAAKYKVLAEMAPSVVFESEHHAALASYQPFEKEWAHLEALKALQRGTHRGPLALRSSGIEYFIPKAFIFIYVAAILASVCAICLVGAYGFSILESLDKTVQVITK